MTYTSSTYNGVARVLGPSGTFVDELQAPPILTCPSGGTCAGEPLSVQVSSKTTASSPSVGRLGIVLADTPPSTWPGYRETAAGSGTYAVLAQGLTGTEIPGMAFPPRPWGTYVFPEGAAPSSTKAEYLTPAVPSMPVLWHHRYWAMVNCSDVALESPTSLCTMGAAGTLPGFPEPTTTPPTTPPTTTAPPSTGEPTTPTTPPSTSEPATPTPSALTCVEAAPCYVRVVDGVTVDVGQVEVSAMTDDQWAQIQLGLAALVFFSSLAAVQAWRHGRGGA